MIEPAEIYRTTYGSNKILKRLWLEISLARIQEFVITIVAEMGELWTADHPNGKENWFPRRKIVLDLGR
jgi:hypothetical protein